MKIGLTIKHFTPNTGGLQWHAQRLVEGLQERGHLVQILTKSITEVPSHSFWYSDASAGKIPQNLRLLGPPRLSFPFLWLAYKLCGRPPLRPVGVDFYCRIFFQTAWRAFKDSHIIHHVGHGSEMVGFVAEKVARVLKVPFVVQPTIHPGHWGDSTIDFLLYRRADRLFAHTEYEKEYFRDKGLGMPIDVVGNGIDDRQDGDAERFRRKHGIDGPMILFLGRKDPDKGYQVLREAHRVMRQSATLVCAGPEARGSLPVEEGGWPVLELGFVSEQEKHDALAACDIFCVPSLGESFGLVYMEAGRYHKPLVCRPIPVLEELLAGAAVFVGERVGHCGGRLTAGELAAALDDLVVNAEKRRELGRVGFEKSENFLWPHVVGRFLEAYQKAL